MLLRPSQITPHRARRIELPGRLAALRADADAGHALDATALLIPGYTGSKEDFAPLLDPIAAAGLDVVAIDLPGQYESGGPDDERDYHSDRLGARLAELVAELARHAPVLLVGHSYGGLVARAAVLAGAPVRGLTLLGSGPAELPPGERRTVLDIGESLLRIQGIEAVQALREAYDAARSGRPADPPALTELLRARFLGSSVPGLLGMAVALSSEPDRTDELAVALRAAGTACLVVCGAADDAWPVDVQRAMARRLDAAFAVVDGAAHSPNTENPDGLLAILLPIWRRWLHL